MMGFSTTPLLSAVGYALVAFVWQGAAIGVAAAIALTMLRRSAPSIRYAVGCIALTLMALAPLITAVRTAQSAPAQRAHLAVTSDRIDVPGIAAVGAGTQAPAPSTSTRWIDPYLPGIAVLWATGVLAGALQLLAGWWRLRRLLRSAMVVEPSRWPAGVRSIAQALGVTARVHIVSSTLAVVPAVVGFLRPAIIVPASAMAGLPAPYLEAVLAHELAHLRRRDYLLNALQCAVEVLLFYHPAVWWVSKRVRLERELCCDDTAVTACGDRDVYVRALVSLEELRSSHARLALGATGSGLLARIRRLVEPSVSEGPTLSGGMIMAVTLSLLLLIGGLQAGADDSAAVPIAPVQQVAPSAAPTAQEASRPAQVMVRASQPAAAKPTPARSATVKVQSAATPHPQAQATGGIDGKVIDPTGGVVPGVTVVVSSQGQTPTRSLVTNARGEFRVDVLPPGTYNITLTLQGFRTATGSVTVGDGQLTPVRFRLEIGRLAESVTVAGASPATVSRPAPSAASKPEQITEVSVTERLVALRRELANLQARGYSPQHADIQRLASTIESLEQQEKTRAAGPQQPIRVGGDIREPRRISDVKPVYPADALAAGIQGLVLIEAIIAKDGSVQRARVLQGVAELDEAAMAAVTQWRYTPTLLNGQPVEVLMTVTISFVAR